MSVWFWLKCWDCLKAEYRVKRTWRDWTRDLQDRGLNFRYLPFYPVIFSHIKTAWWALISYITCIWECQEVHRLNQHESKGRQKDQPGAELSSSASPPGPRATPASGCQCRAWSCCSGWWGRAWTGAGRWCPGSICPWPRCPGPRPSWPASPCCWSSPPACWPPSGAAPARWGHSAGRSARPGP